MIYKVEDLFLRIRNGMSIKQEMDAGGLPITRIETIANAEINLERVGHADLTMEQAKNYLLEDCEILFSHINSVSHIGKCALYKKDMGELVHGMNLLSFKPNQTLLFPKYALYALRSQQFKDQLVKSIKKAVNQASVSIGDIKNITLNVPPLAQQQRIAAILDKAAEIKAKREQAIAKLDELAQSTFVEMFGDAALNAENWEILRLDELVEDSDTINYGVVQPGDDVDVGVPLLRVGDLVSRDFSIASLKKITPAIESKYKRSRIKGNEILISCVGTIGTVVAATSDMVGFNIARAVARVPVSNKINKVYLENYLRSKNVQRYFFSVVTLTLLFSK